ncbi:unnamed protein product [Rhizophagus irregularis]|nr:unnamed protein product [Rhizophagus irregularis]
MNGFRFFFNISIAGALVKAREKEEIILYAIHEKGGEYYGRIYTDILRLFRTSQIEVSDPEYQTRIWTSICYDRKSDDQNNNLKSLPNILSSGFSLASSLWNKLIGI